MQTPLYFYLQPYLHHFFAVDYISAENAIWDKFALYLVQI